MADEELERRIAGLEHQHRLMRWYIGRVDRDLAEIAGTQVEHTERLDRIDTKLVEHMRDWIGSRRDWIGWRRSWSSTGAGSTRLTRRCARSRSSLARYSIGYLSRGSEQQPRCNLERSRAWTCEGGADQVSAPPSVIRVSGRADPPSRC